ncbi:hypothetical protein K5D68_22110 [Pseudomonas cichorii]|nr:hypothetical protein [Pseudomonas cichorii]MBX8587148.1 hypothetical protein [Pseudomonas cichorii]
MIPVQFEGFMDFVLTQTRSGRLKWGAGEGGSFIASHKDMSLFISSDYDPDRDISTFWFRLNSSSGSTPFSVSDKEQDFSFMRILFEEVIANANNVKNDLANFMAGFE